MRVQDAAQRSRPRCRQSQYFRNTVHRLAGRPGNRARLRATCEEVTHPRAHTTVRGSHWAPQAAQRTGAPNSHAPRGAAKAGSGAGYQASQTAAQRVQRPSNGRNAGLVRSRVRTRSHGKGLVSWQGLVYGKVDELVAPGGRIQRQPPHYDVALLPAARGTPLGQIRNPPRSYPPPRTARKWDIVESEGGGGGLSA